MTDLARLRQLVAMTDAVPDADLLHRFVTDRDGPAFAALVRRHGPMVLAVCRRVLRHRQDAEDAFQATFLVLARRAETIKLRSPLGGWLYGVAYRTALSARRAASVRRERESRAAEMKSGELIPDNGLAAELREALDRELAALPDTYRAAVVVCDLEGLHRRDAALRLGWTEGTLSSRLARARALLARRLARYGLAVPAAGLAAVAGPEAVAHALAEPTVRLGTLVAAGEAVVAAPVAALMEGTMKAMLLLKFKALAASAVVGCAVAATALAGWRADAAGTAEPSQPDTPRAETPRRAAQKPDSGSRAVPKSDKERIAELERERDQLLKQVAELAARLDRVEAERQAARPEKRKPSAQTAEDIARAEKLVAEKLAAEKLARDIAQADKLAAEKLARDSALAEKIAAEKRVKAAQEIAQAAERRALEKLKAAQDVAAQAQKQAKEALDLAQQRDPAPKAAPPADRRPTGSPVKPTDPFAQRDLVPTAKAVVRVYTVGDLAGDEKEGEALAKVVRATVEPKSWGTDAGVEYLPGRKVLVVRQTAKAHDEVNELLVLLRSQQKAPAGR
ncbi:RNA polymerase sigma factor [Frigoriglobus tundricola]|uniref:Uncharacterized protein n=1 Tax=Frigoriglobus tundricola TaxID=2774151 RepID=A0A6M5YS70_9BACT|nr:RNA polymerase sigma factor [Frigoriglobus tundricola]QJW96848.1 hypothetical protein FTUN_4408 [Frigoriglobus tundricola]